MEIRKFLNKYFALILVVIIAATSRLLPHLPNLTPIGGLAIFSGINFNKKGVFIPLLAMLVSDLFLGLHLTIPFVYISFVFIFFLGQTLKNKSSFTNLVFISLISSVIFFIITNFGSWLTSGMYPQTFNGLTNAYIMGIPFFRNTLIGDLFYSLTLFYGFKYSVSLFSKINLIFKKSS